MSLDIRKLIFWVAVCLRIMREKIVVLRARLTFSVVCLVRPSFLSLLFISFQNLDVLSTLQCEGSLFLNEFVNEWPLCSPVI